RLLECMPFMISVRRFFFFSSRRRHTRSKRDWSSDVVLFRSVVQPGPGDGAQLRLIEGDARAESAHRERGAHDEWVAEVLGRGEAVVHRVGDPGAGDLRAATFHDPFEGMAVFTGVDRLHPDADEFDVVFRQHARIMEGDGGVERRLPSERGEDRVGAFLGDDRFHHLRGDGFDVGGVGELRVGHDRGRVGVDEDDPQALLPQHAAGLGARVVELRGLADDDGAGADDENTGAIGTTWHQASLRNESSKWWASEGPAPSSGWNWSPATGFPRATKPSAEPSLRLTWVISTSGLPAKSTV